MGNRENDDEEGESWTEKIIECSQGRNLLDF